MPEAKPSWDTLAQSIADGEAILVLGPDAIPLYPANSKAAVAEKPAGEKTEGAEKPTEDEAAAIETSFSRLSRRRIRETLNGQINYFYHRDNLFGFSDAAAKQQAMKEVRNAARDTAWLPDAELMRQIVALPFPVVLNLNPDKYLYQAFIQYYREPQFDYFTTRDKPNPPTIEYPDGLNKPLVFNLCGSVLDKLDSVILDYNDLFELLKNLLIDNGVSPQLTRKLQEADRFVLLGFELERWYFQLLLHYLNKLDNNPFNNPNQNFPILSEVTADTRAFVMDQFNIQHIATSRADFEQLYRACEAKKILRKLLDPTSSTETQVRMLTVQGKYEEAFQLLEPLLGQNDQQIELTHLRARYNAWLQNTKNKTVDQRELDIEINRIRYTLITFASQIPQA